MSFINSQKIKEFFLKENKRDFLSKKNSIFLAVILIIMTLIAPENKFNWIGLTLAMFSTMTNDSVQTLGTFITSNSKVPWWKLWLYVSLLFIITITLAWLYNYHHLDFNRLKTIPYSEGVKFVTFIPPILLIVLTYYKIPVSSTFLILSVFASQKAIGAVLVKTLSGYVIGFVLSYALWMLVIAVLKKQIVVDASDKKLKRWKFIQWLSTGILWVAWLTNNTSNVVVYVPRAFSVYGLVIFIILGVIMIGFTFYNRGGPIQEIVSEKNDMTNLRSMSIVNLCFAFVILGLGKISNVPMATTWVFIGILAGRELCLAQLESDGVLTLRERYKKARKFILKDLILAGLGIAVSLSFAIINNNYIK